MEVVHLVGRLDEGCQRCEDVLEGVLLELFEVDAGEGLEGTEGAGFLLVTHQPRGSAEPSEWSELLQFVLEVLLASFLLLLNGLLERAELVLKGRTVRLFILRHGWIIIVLLVMLKGRCAGGLAHHRLPGRGNRTNEKRYVGMKSPGGGVFKESGLE